MPYIDIMPFNCRKKSVCSIVVESLETRRLLSVSYTFQPLGSFAAAGATGSAPASQLVIDGSGNLFGFTTAGGANSTGAAYELAVGTSTPTLLVSFPAATSGVPFVATGPVIDAAGDLFGVTEAGGDANQDGTIFEIAHGSGAITQLAEFDAATTGQSPGGTVAIDAAGDLFGTTANGGAFDCGTVWALPKGSTTINRLASFSPVFVGGIGQNPGANGIAFDRSGNLYGTTAGNAASGSYGTVWELPNGSGTISTIASFNGANGATPTGGVAVDAHGNVFGVTQFGGDNFNTLDAPMGTGVVFEVPTGQGQPAVLADSDDPSVGQFPIGRVALDTAGDLFGTTSVGGDATASFTGDGTVWEVPAQTVSPRTLEKFNGTGGSIPKGALVTDAVGNVFGTTTAGGALGGGGIFEMDFAGANSSSSSLTPTVIKSTLPANVAAGKVAQGSTNVAIANSTSTIVRGVFTVAIYAAPDGIIDGSAIKIGSLKRTLVVPKKSKTTVAVSIPSFHTSIAGSYTLLAQISNSAGSTSAASTGPVVTVAPAIVTLTETFGRITLPAAIVSGSKSKARVQLKIKNSGNVPATGKVKIALSFAPVDGLTASTQIVSLTPRLVIAAGGSTTVTVPIASIPVSLAGSFTLLAQVTDATGGASSATGPATYTIS